ncbi:MAG TPA: acetyl-CoA C-acyltransferase, partial [Myxococcales bacterium]
MDAVIIDAVRTPVGKLRGALSAVRPDDLAAYVIEQLLRRNPAVQAGAVDEVFFGCANQAGEDNRNVARMALLLAGLPDHVPGVTLNRLCASGLEAAVQAARAIRLGDMELCVAGGVESMTRAPWTVAKPETAFAGGSLQSYDTSLGWRFPNPRLAKRFPLESMGETAENVAVKYRIARERQDEFALRSHQRALAAQEAGRYRAELLPVTVPGKQPVVVDRDEQPRADTSLEKLAKLKPAFREGGTVTAGNSSSLNDGAAALLLASSRKASELGLRPLARV